MSRDLIRYYREALADCGLVLPRTDADYTAAAEAGVRYFASAERDDDRVIRLLILAVAALDNAVTDYSDVVQALVAAERPSDEVPAHRIEGTFDHFDRYVG